MNNNGQSTGNTEQTQNNTATGTTPDELDYSTVAAALESGNMDDLSRLMAGEVAQKPDNKDQKDTPQGTEVDADGTDSVDSTDPAVTTGTESATTAAPTAADTPPELSETDKLRQELHQLRSEIGRMPHLQRTVNQLQNDLRAEKARTAAITSQPTPTRAPVEPELPDSLKAKLESLKAIDPDLAEIMTTMYKENAKQAFSSSEEVRRQIVDEEQQRQAESFYLQQKAELTRLVPQHEEIFSMPEWAQWKASLTPGQLALAESGYANEVLIALQGFAHYMQGSNQTQQVDNSTQQPTASGGGDPSNNTNVAAVGNTNLQDQRARKVETGAATRSAAAKVTTSTLDEDKYFSEMYNKIGAETGVIKK